MRIGIDLGGTKIEGLVLDASGRECARARVPTPTTGYLPTLDAIADLLARLEREAGLDPGLATPIGLGTPGSLSPHTGLIRNANSTCLNGQPLDRDLARRLGRRIRIENDANCLALSEATDGAAAGADPVFAVILGTGVGGAIVAGGALLRGAMAIGGEWGHNPLPVSGAPGLHEAEWPGPPCYCGRRGCIETWLSGPGLAADHLRAAYRAVDPSDGLPDPPAARASALAAARADRVIAPALLADLAQTGDPAARASLDRWFDRLARSLATVINLIDPEVIVVAGGLSQIDALYREVPRRWVEHVFADQVDTRLVPAMHGDASGVRGAAWLWPSPAGERPLRPD
jgi:fructokinase